MFAFDTVLISSAITVLVALAPIIRKKKGARNRAKAIFIAMLPIICLCGLAFFFRWESDILNIRSEKLYAEIDIKGFEPNTDSFYSNISYGPYFKIGSKVYTGGQYVNMPSGESGYFYKLQTSEP